VFPKDALIWCTDGSRANSGAGSGIFGLRPNRSFSFPLGKLATVFQTEIYAILQCACENVRRAYKNKRILIFSDSQAALKALSGPKVTSGLVAECLDALSELASLKKVTPPGCRGTGAFLEMRKLISLLHKRQLRLYSVQSRLLKYLSVRKEKQLRTGLGCNTLEPG